MELLDNNLQRSWFIYADYLKDSLKKGNISEAIRFAESLERPELAFVVGPFPVYWALLYAYDRKPDKTFEIVRKAHDYGSREFPRFDSEWWTDTTSEEYLLLKPIHENSEIQEYVRSAQKRFVESWGFDVAKTPFCWLEKKEFTKTKATCNISKKRIKKGDAVYEYRYFSGGGDTSSEPFFADANAFEKNESAVRNSGKFAELGYDLEDYSIRVRYAHPSLNHFWNRIEEFDLLRTLQLIAEPPTNPTPYVKLGFDRDPANIYDPEYDENEAKEPVNRGMGGKFLNLLYVLIQCGYGPRIVEMFPDLPEHFPYLFLFFGSDRVRGWIEGKINADTGELFPLLDIAFKSYNKKTPEDIRALASYGKKNPVFLDNLAACLNVYECHLYSNYRPGANWFFSEFSRFHYAKGAGLLDFFITRPEPIPSLATMKAETCLLYGITSASDAYENSLPYLYRTVMFHLAFSKAPSLPLWSEQPATIRKNPYKVNFKRIHGHAVKTIQKLNRIGFEI